MLHSISDKLFMGSLILLMISVVISGIGFQFVNWRSQVSDEMDEEQGSGSKSSARKKSVMDKQDKSLRRVYRSYLFWIAIAGILVSIGLSFL